MWGVAYHCHSEPWARRRPSKYTLPLLRQTGQTLTAMSINGQAVMNSTQGHILTSLRALAIQEGRGSVFGGLLMAQAISAASATVGTNFYLYTSYSSFIRPIVAIR